MLMYTSTRINSTDVPPTQEGYILPFRDAPVCILQGYNGPVSHILTEIQIGGTLFRMDDRFSLDFILPLGTEVIAAKKGRVLRAYDGSDKYYLGLELAKGQSTLVNSVSLFHDDGTATLYSHLAQGSVGVQVNQQVEQGHPLARSGLSGWIGPEPHLHFAALRFARAGARRTFPVRFDNYHGSLEHDLIDSNLASLLDNFQR